MPFARPTLTELKQDVASDISSNLPGSDAFLRFSNLGVTGKAVAGLANGHYGYLDWIAKQCTPGTATDEYLEMWAGLKNVIRKGPVAWQGTATFPGTVGAELPEGVVVVRSDGLQYQTTAISTVAADGVVTAPLEALLTPADLYGSNWNIDDGAPVTLGGGIANIGSNGTIASTTQEGVDVESDDQLRTRMLQVYASPPAGGAQSDYVEWAEAVPGVTRAWCWRNGMGPGTVVVYFIRDTPGVAPGFPVGTNGVATSETRDIDLATGDQLVVANYIWALQPVTALVYAVAPPSNQISFTIEGWAGVAGTVQTAVEAAIDGVLLAQGAQGGAVDLGAIEAAVEAVTGAAALVISAVTCTNGTVAGGALGNVTSSALAVPVRGAIIAA